MQHVQDVMTRNPETCKMEDSITRCLGIMRDENCGAVPIVDSEKRIQGIITDRDIALCLLEEHAKAPDELKVRDCLRSTRIITCKPEDDLHEAIRLMEQNQIRRLPVVDDQTRVVGIVAQADIVLKDRDKEEVVEFVQEVSKARLG